MSHDDSNPDVGAKPSVVIVASQRSRESPNSPLLWLARDYADMLKRFTLYTTEGTGRILFGTGLYEESDVVLKRSGRDGGIAQLAAMVARGESSAVILLLDPSDPWSDAVENRALKRVCIQSEVRVITTYAAATRWITYEASEVARSTPRSSWRPTGWREGKLNITETGTLAPLPLEERSLALISHDKKKLEMVEFVNGHAEHLAKHDRILTTGTTGWVLKLLYADTSLDKLTFEAQSQGKEKEKRYCEILEALIQSAKHVPPDRANLRELVQFTRQCLMIHPNENFSERVMPLPSGPDGGDVLIADEVLAHKCHTILFFHDPTTAHPHNDDIRLLEHTSQIRDVFAECVSDRQSAERWIQGLEREASEGSVPLSTAARMRQIFGLRDAVTVDFLDDHDGPTLGEAMARACAGYFHQKISRFDEPQRTYRIGVAWGWGTKQVLNELVKMEARGLIQKPRLPSRLLWTPLIGTITAEFTDREASVIAQEYCDFYGGSVEGIACAGFARIPARLPEAVRHTIHDLEKADLILTSASPWNEDASLYKNTGLDHHCFPPLSEAVGLISGVFLNPDGTELRGEYSVVGLGYSGFRQAVENGEVILMCGGESRRRVLHAALLGSLASVVITTSLSAKWALSEQERAETKVRLE